MTKIYKFGGASVKDAAAVKNIVKILSQCEKVPVVVISAMGKTTNALEKVAEAYFYKNADAFALLENVKKYHQNILNELFEDKKHPVFEDIHNTFVEVEWVLEDAPIATFDFHYDQIVSIGELISTKIVSHYLTLQGIKNSWEDARALIQTDNTYRNAKVNWTLSEKYVNEILPKKIKDKNIIITQGFIGGTSENYTTTLGREGSDFSAAILAFCLSAESVSIWKDVQGVLNADPKYFDETNLLSNISYQEAVELAYYGASIIHPKTIKPLQNKNIPLLVCSFIDTTKSGTTIDKNTAKDALIPSYIYKVNQVLISISPRDYSFIAEDNMSEILKIFAKNQVKIDLMQNSAISMSACLDNDLLKLPDLLKDLEEKYSVKYNENLELLTVRHYTEEIIEKNTAGKEILVEQRSRHTARFVLREK